jgi:single-strand DNA-binding protein
MASYAKTIILGNLGRDPEAKFLPSGDAVTNFSVAVTETYKNKSGEKQETTTWYRCECFGKQAEVAGKYLTKGSQVLVEGKMRSRKFKDKDGADRESWDLRIDNFQMMGGKKDGDSAPAPQRSSQGASKDAFADFESDVPFTSINRKLSMVM